MSVRVLVAPDKFKGTMSGFEVAAALAAGVRDAGGEAVEAPIADGGDGTAEVLLTCGGGHWVEAAAVDANGRPVAARFALLADGRTAVVDVAEAGGLWRVAPDERNAVEASSAGTGMLVAAAAAAGAEVVVVAAGGSATTDGGEGAAAVLAGMPRLPELVVACDTRVAFEDAARVYAPQKGASPDDVVVLERRLRALAAEMPRDPTGVPMTGAAGGLAGGLWARFGARLVSGASLVLDTLGVDALLADVDAAFTGEGCLDEQTATGKAVGELAARCRSAAVPCYAFVGRNDLSLPDQSVVGLAAVVEAGTPPELRRAAADIVRSLL